MIRVEKVSFGFPNRPLLEELTFSVNKGEVFGILGPNGCGKSTLLKLLRGMLQPSHGNIYCHRQPLATMTRQQISRTISVVTQSAEVTFPYSVIDTVSMGRYVHRQVFGGLSRSDHTAIRHALAVTDTLSLADRSVTALSGGELQRVFIARALAQKTPVLLLDEATSHLDIDHRLEIAELLLQQNREEGTTIIHVSHDLELTAEISQRILLFDSLGRVVAIGPPSQVLTRNNLRAAFRVEVAVEPSPFSGAPRIFPVFPLPGGRIQTRIHVLAGGGNGAEIVRRLHRNGCQVTLGPVNKGDSDEVLGTALGLEMVQEESFCPFSEQNLSAAEHLASKAQLLVIAPVPWGPGNLGSLDLAMTCLRKACPVVVMDPRAERDYTNGKAWQKIQQLLTEGAICLPGSDELLRWLRQNQVDLTGTK